MFDSLFGDVSTGRQRVGGASGEVELATLSALGEDPRGLVVFLHGLTGSKEDFVMAVPEVANRGYAALAYDHRGNYESEHLPPYSLEVFADDAAALIEHWADDLGLPVHLVGHSFGGLVAERVAARQPQRLASLTLMCSGPGGMGEQERLRVLCDLLESGMELSEIFQRKVEIDDDQLPEFLVTFLRTRFVASDRRALLAIARAVMDTPDQIEELVGALPAFVMYGAGDGSWPQPVQNAMAERLGTRPQVIPDAVHSPALENVDGTAQLIVDNADSLSTARG